MKTLLAGIDIGGTKCAVSLGLQRPDGAGVLLAGKERFPTPDTPEAAITNLIAALDRLLDKEGDTAPAAIGISCGGPLDSKTGIIWSPPNLPGWDGIDIVSPFRERYGVSVALQNDANACALAEWKWGAGAGCANMVFLTFGTGLGAGLILGGRLYAGASDMAGEVGHVRLSKDGPIGFGKPGSFEGYCSGGGIARLAQSVALSMLQAGKGPDFCPSYDKLPLLSAKIVGEAAQAGDPVALDIYRQVGTRMGQGLAILIDILNPERIVIGSIYARQRELLEPHIHEVLKREALEASLKVCSIVPAGLGEKIGDFAGMSVALYALNRE
jgi:glucokinase